MALKSLFQGSNLARLIALLLSAASIIMQGGIIGIASTVTIDFGIGYFLPVIAASGYSFLYSAILLALSLSPTNRPRPLAVDLVCDALGFLSNITLAGFALTLAHTSEFYMYPCAAGASPESKRWCGEARAAVGMMYASYVVMIFVGIMHLGHWFGALGRCMDRKQERQSHGKAVELRAEGGGEL